MLRMKRLPDMIVYIDDRVCAIIPPDGLLNQALHKL